MKPNITSVGSLVDDISSPILHFNRSIFRDNIIHSGRPYIQPQWVDKIKWVIKSDDFINWADNIIKAVKRKLIKHKHQLESYNCREYLGANDLMWKNKSKAEVGVAGCQLKPIKTTSTT